MSSVTIVMYHFVRDLPRTRFPAIKGLLTSAFEGQLAYLEKRYAFITVKQLMGALHDGERLPENGVLLTFDDGYADHYQTVFPRLEERGIQGCFFPPAKAVLEHEVLDVNKIHFILAAAKDVGKLLTDVYGCLDEARGAYGLESNEAYFARLGVANRFDPKEVIFIKRLLQRELPLEARRAITARLFARYVTADEAAFACELYLSAEQLQLMARCGMYVGSHGHDHFWLDTLPVEGQRREIELSLAFLRGLGVSTERWMMCYPFGAYNESLLKLLRGHGCGAGVTTRVGVAGVSAGNALTLERLDTTDLPVVG